MCGIVGVALYKAKAPQYLADALEAMKYRGYDSAGAAVLKEKNDYNDKILLSNFDYHNEIEVVKVLGGDISKLRNISDSQFGIAHRRWATHGATNIKNQHPHLDSKNTLAIVHNGTVQNFKECYQKLLTLRFNEKIFHTQERENLENIECDSAILPLLLTYFYEKYSISFNDAYPKAIRTTTKMLQGENSFLICPTHTHFKQRIKQNIYAIQNGLPLFIGIGDFGTIVASDPVAFPQNTKKVLEMRKGQVATLHPTSVEISSVKDGTPIESPFTIFTPLRVLEITKPFEHNMLKEIHDQKTTLMQCYNTNQEKAKELSHALSHTSQSLIFGCGTSFKMAQFLAHLLNENGRNSTAVQGSEWKTYKALLNKCKTREKSDQVKTIFFSQSGNTGDLMDLLRFTKENNIWSAGLVNVEHSPIATKVDLFIPLSAGIENSVASTKATTAQLLLAYMTIYPKVQRQKLEDFLSTEIHELLCTEKLSELIKIAHTQIPHAQRQIFILGKGHMLSMAEEAEIKLSEVGYLPACGIAAGEMKHGIIARIEQDIPVIGLLDDATEQSTRNNIIQCKSRGAHTIAIGPEKFRDKKAYDTFIPVPDIKEFQALPNLIAIQLLAYAFGKVQNLPIDFPRNLAKSVTVE